MGGIAAATQGSGVGNPAVAVGPGWLLDPRFDRHFIFTSAAIAILSGVLVAARPGLFVPVLMLDLWLLGYHHVVSTYTRLCFDRDSFARRRWLIVGLLPAVFGGLDENERLGRAIFYLVPLWGILHRAHQAPETFLGQELWHPPVPAIVVDLVAVLALAGLAWWGIGRLRLWRARRLPVGHTLYMLSHFAVFYAGYVAIENIDAGWVALNIWHNAQYIAFVWLQNNRRFEGVAVPAAGFLSPLSQRRNLWAYLVLRIAISTVFYASLQWSAAALGLGMTALMVVYQTINFHHYIVDAVIWQRPRRGQPQAGSS